MRGTPRWSTIVVALLLVGLGVLGTFVGAVPASVGAWSLAAATAVLLAGVAFRGL